MGGYGMASGVAATTVPLATGDAASTDNQVGIGGMLVCHQPHPQYQIATMSDASNADGTQMNSQPLPTYSKEGLDETQWECFVSRTRALRRSGAAGNLIYYFVWKVNITFSGCRLASNNFMLLKSLGTHHPVNPISCTTFEDPREQERVCPVLCCLLRRDRWDGEEPLARICQPKEVTEEDMVWISDSSKLLGPLVELQQGTEESDGSREPLLAVHQKERALDGGVQDLEYEKRPYKKQRRWGPLRVKYWDGYDNQDVAWIDDPVCPQAQKDSESVQQLKNVMSTDARSCAAGTTDQSDDSQDLAHDCSCPPHRQLKRVTFRVKTQQNKQEKFASEPSVRFKTLAMSGHLKSKTHNEVVELEKTQRGSIFQKEITNRKAAEAKTIECIMHNLHFLMKEEISNRKAAQLNQLVALQGCDEMKYFQHKRLEGKNLDTSKLASTCTDGASVMTGEQNGLAGLLRRDFPTILTFNCVCHRLALATVDTSKEADMKCIENVHNCLRQVWQLLENSSKKMATFIKIQANHNNVSLSGKGEEGCGNEATEGLQDIILSKTFQTGSLSYAYIKGSINYAKDQLHQLLEGAKKVAFLRDLISDLEEDPLSLTITNLTQEDDMDTSLRQLCQSQKQYPLLSHIAEICYSAPVSNAWLGRGVSAVKLQTLLKDDMLNVLLYVSINGPSLAAADGVIQEATKTWLTDKSRYKLDNASQARQVLRGKEELPVVFYSAGKQTEEAGLNLEAEMEEAKEE
ncbi:hypothetical protein AWC38_SpisGene17016 [Stylophora pistillata]|uniref:Zinc finger protein 862 n=1 Tax=Stylophora pistillata TaxID=50429 RepID=A0A2B4RQS8_STYPI|nr:hypothetical protein AWC38_SpisGene17016 [Stylophora pistillata]